MAQKMSLSGLYFAIALSILRLASGVSFADEALSVSKLVSTWRDNEHTFERVRISWSASTQQPLTPSQIATDVEKRRVPRINESRADKRPSSLILSGDKYRLSTFRFFTHNGLTTPVSDVSAFDSNLSYKLFDGIDGVPANGIIARKQPRHLGSVGPLIAVSIVFRPFASGILSDMDSPVIDSKASEIEGRQCYSVTYPHPRAIAS